ncbi:MAG TPA: hypothetical protein VM115_07745 [Vicinamibacterales bacterium]|nr:hypothetical protein [Vicinamibacterales bacterium]
MPATVLVRRLVYILACVLPIWAVVAYFTGGVGWMLGPIRLSSRQPLRPLLIGLVVAGFYVWKYSRADREADGAWLHRWGARVLPFTVPLAAAVALYAGIHYGSFAAAGSDSYGYVSQARFWLTGIPRVQQPWVLDFPWENREWIFSPLGYRPFSPDGTIVPTYPAGLPMLMAAFLAVFGANGPFYVAPVLAALTVWFTYMLGRDAAGSRTVGALAAALLVASPPFLTHVMVPMSDVPAAAGWVLVAVLALKQKPLAAGIVTGLALFIRPNLILLALVPGFAWRWKQEPLARFATGLVPGIVAIMLVNFLLYGGPLTNGYASLVELYGFGALPLNVRNYVVWLMQTETPLILLAVIPLFVRTALRQTSSIASPRACVSALIGLTFLSYLFYATFDHWFYLRFLLPAYPAIFVLFAAAMRWLTLKAPVEARVPAAAVVCLFMILFGVKVAKDDSVFLQAGFEQRHVRAALEVRSRTPPDAMVLSVQHSGSVRYYADRITLRYDWLAEGALDAALRDLAAKGRRAYLVVDDWEEKEFRARFSPANHAAQLGAPLVRVSGSPEVRIFELQPGDPAPTP